MLKTLPPRIDEAYSTLGIEGISGEEGGSYTIQVEESGGKYAALLYFNCDIKIAES